MQTKYTAPDYSVAAGDALRRDLIILTDETGRFVELVKEKGVKVLIDPKALMHVIGNKMNVDDFWVECSNCPPPLVYLVWL
jgi:hypothetical protein